jgi:phage-related protein
MVQPPRSASRSVPPTTPDPTITPLKRVPAIFYRTKAGNEPVRDWLKSMDREDRRRIGEDVKVVEVRSDLPNNRIARVLFYIDRRQRMVLLHGFIKKSRATPAEDLELARANKRKHERGLP